MPTAQDKTRVAAAADERRELVAQSRALAPYGTAEELSELMRRFKALVPGGKRMDDGAITALAQFSLLYGLSPFNQECGYFNDAPHALIRGFRKKGREFLGQRQSHEDLRYEVIDDPKERLALAIPDGALAVKCIGTASHKVQAWQAQAEKWREILGKDAPWEAVVGQAGPRPETIGYGIVDAVEIERLEHPTWLHKCSEAALNTVEITRQGRQGEYTIKLRELRGFEPCPTCGQASRANPNMFPHVQRAEKRAEAHWWKLETDLALELAPGVEGGSGPIIEGRWSEVDDEGRPVGSDVADLEVPGGLTGPELEEWLSRRAQDQAAEAERQRLTPEERKARAEKGARTLFGPEPPPEAEAKPVAADTAQAGKKAKPAKPEPRRSAHVWPPAIVNLIRKEVFHKADEPSQHVVGLLQLTPFSPQDDPRAILAWCGLYETARHDLGMGSTAEAQEWADRMWEEQKAKEAS